MKIITRTADPIKTAVGYRSFELLCESGHARVYRAQRIQSGHPVILKTVTARGDAERAAARLQREYEVLRILRGEGVPRVLGMERPADIPMLVLEDIGGVGLDRVLTQRRLNLREALHIGERLAASLALLHSAGIVHRNLNPE